MHIEALAERAAILGGVPTTTVRHAAKQTVTERSASNAAGGDDHPVMRRLEGLERYLRSLIARTRLDPPTLLLYVEVLAAVERQMWKLEQKQRVDGTRKAD